MKYGGGWTRTATVTITNTIYLDATINSIPIYGAKEMMIFSIGGINKTYSSWSSGVYDTIWGWSDIDPSRYMFTFNDGSRLHFYNQTQFNAVGSGNQTAMFQNTIMTNINYTTDSTQAKILGIVNSCYMNSLLITPCSSNIFKFKLPTGATSLLKWSDGEVYFNNAWSNNIFNINAYVYFR